MDANHILVAAGCAAFLGLAVLTVIRGVKPNPLVLPTALLCADIFAYGSLELLGRLTGHAFWEYFESAAAALAAPLLVHLILTFLGARERRRVMLGATYAYYGALALASVAPLVQPAWSSFPGGELWALFMLVGLVTFGFSTVLLVRHYRESGSPEERSRTLLFMLTIAVGVGSPATDLAVIAGLETVPELSAGGLLISAILLTAFALRARFVTGSLLPLLVAVVLIGLVGVVAQLLVFRWLGGETAAFLVGTIFVTVVVLSGARVVWSEYTEVRERTAHLATLGRLSSQMAHDIRNPLAAIRGAAQYLAEERARGSDLESQGEFLGLILEQTDRLEKVVQDYRRLGAAKPTFEEANVEALVAGVVARASMAPGAAVDVLVEPHDGTNGEVRIDPELVTVALENLVRNSVEAFGDQEGEVRVSVARRGPSLILRVADDGPGMDARTRAQAERAFFTTKAQGSGLGLAFVRRVAEAHGGAMTVKSALGRGTTVELTLRPEAMELG